MNRIRSFIVEQIKSLMFVFAFGVLGGNLLGALMGGFSAAQAASQTLDTPPAAVSNVHYALDPSNPALVDSMKLSVTKVDGSDPISVKVKVGDLQWIACSRTVDGLTWFCPLNGGRVSDLDRLQVWAG